MKNNPCRVCRMRDEDKNNRLCLGCEKRIIYDQQLEQELNFSKSYTDTCLYAGSAIPWRPYFPAG